MQAAGLAEAFHGDGADRRQQQRAEHELLVEDIGKRAEDAGEPFD